MTGPIFITGGSRCGTELARSILNRHSLVHIALETHYFDDPLPRLNDPAKPSDAEKEALLDHFMRVSGHGYGLRTGDVKAPMRDALRTRWAALGDNADALFAAFCELEAEAKGKVIWGEKTPRHVFRISEMLEAFPNAKIIICIRDPRAAIASYRDWRNNWIDRNLADNVQREAIEAEEKRASRSFNLTVATLLWSAMAKTALQAQQHFGDDRIFILRFETLVNEPEATAEELMRWIGLVYDPAILSVPVRNSSYAPGGQATGVVAQVAERWREKITPQEDVYIRWLAKSGMRRLGYEDQAAPIPLLFTVRQLAALPFELIRIARINSSRIGSWLQFLAARLKALS